MQKELYEVGIVFRGFILVNHIFKKLPLQKEHGVTKDLRGAFISAINSFTETAFNKNPLEYLESGNILFIFKLAKIQSQDNNCEEPLILYGLLDKSKKKSDKLTRKFFERVDPILQLFIEKFDGKNFSELNQFETFERVIEESLIKKPQE
ncbi:MAG: hypothetical protein ACFFCI_04980 [Promethearchaeota archaeon]